MSLLKIININDPGTGFRFGGDDLDEVNRILSGEDRGKLIKFENIVYFGGAQKFRVLRPNGTNWVSFNSEAETANRAILVPLLGADQRMVFESLSQPLSNKSINFANNTPTNFPGAAINNASVDGSKLIDASVNGGKLIDNTVGNAKIVDLAFSKITGQIAMSQITDNSITNAKLQQIAHSKVGTNLINSESGLTGVRTVTHPDVSYKALGEANTATITNKIWDTRSNTPIRLSRTGKYYATSELGVDADGVLTDLQGIGTLANSNVNTGGKYHNWQTLTGSSGDVCGVALLSSWISTRYQNPLVRFAFSQGMNTLNNRRSYKGITSGQRLYSNSDSAPLLDSESGFIFGHGAADNNFQIWYNDGTGPCQKLDTTVPLSAVAINYIVEIQAVQASAGFRWTLYNVDQTTGGRGSQVTNGTGLITSRIPGQNTHLYLEDIVYSGSTAQQTNSIHYIEVFS